MRSLRLKAVRYTVGNQMFVGFYRDTFSERLFPIIAMVVGGFIGYEVITAVAFINGWVF